MNDDDDDDEEEVRSKRCRLMFMTEISNEQTS
jgi:hypothetical protein